MAGFGASNPSIGAFGAGSPSGATSSTGTPSSGPPPSEPSAFSYGVSQGTRRGSNQGRTQTPTGSSVPLPSAAFPRSSSLVTAQSSTTPAVPSMFGSYSSTAPLGFSRSSTAGTSAVSSPSRIAGNAGYWRAPAVSRGAGSTSAAQTSASSPNLQRHVTFVPGPAVNRTASGWMTADPAGWSGSATETNRDGVFQENSLLSFTWLIEDLSLLRDEVERWPFPSEEGRSVSAGAGKSSIWTSHPIFGDGRWKVELIRSERDLSQGAKHSAENDGAVVPSANDASSASPRAEAAEPSDASTVAEDDSAAKKASSSVTVLSLYLTSMVHDYGDRSIAASLFFGIRPTSTSGSMSSRPWIWTSSTAFTFRREAEYYECHNLPTLSRILENHEADKADSFELVIQIGTGPQMVTVDRPRGTMAPMPFEIPEARVVPKSLLSGLEDMIDCAATGDIALMVRERGIVPSHATSSGPSSGATSDSGPVELEVQPWPVGQPMPEVTADGEAALPEVVVRDRILWVHSSMLRARSEYFRTMLESEFSEGQGQELGKMDGFGRNVRVLRVPDADFNTAQALVRYLYTSDIEYMDYEDVRGATLDDEWLRVGPHSDERDDAQRGEHLPVWEWRSLEQIEAGEGSSTVPPQGRSDHGREGSGRQGSPVAIHVETPTHSHGRRSASYTETSSSSSVNSRRLSRDSHTTSGVPTSPGRFDVEGSRGGKGKAKADGQEVQDDPMIPAAGATAYRSALIAALRADPHPHPAPRTCGAPALAMYRLAHRYTEPNLAVLSKTHIMGTLTPSKAFPVLLATNLYPEVHHSVHQYVLNHWETVAATEEFERCCDEVSMGEWGLDAGRALRTFMRSLASPQPKSGSANKTARKA